MPQLNWNEIKRRAIVFANNWAKAARERSDAQTFWNEFFEVFGLRRASVASFEVPVQNLSGHTDFIDLFWKGKLLAEHKSRGKPLDRAQSQAMDYIQSLQREGRGDEVPRFVVVSDFARLMYRICFPSTGPAGTRAAETTLPMSTEDQSPGRFEQHIVKKGKKVRHFGRRWDISGPGGSPKVTLRG